MKKTYFATRSFLESSAMTSGWKQTVTVKVSERYLGYAEKTRSRLSPLLSAVASDQPRPCDISVVLVICRRSSTLSWMVRATSD